MATSATSGGSNWRVQLTALLLVSLAVGRVSSQSLGTVYVTAQDYSSEHQAGNIQGLYCDQPGNDNPYPTCESNYWVAYSVSLNPPMSESLCGQCLQITNNDGGKSVKACILDQKQATGLDLDEGGFTALDTDGQGYASGHLYCTVDFVSC